MRWLRLIQSDNWFGMFLRFPTFAPTETLNAVSRCFGGGRCAGRCSVVGCGLWHQVALVPIQSCGWHGLGQDRTRIRLFSALLPLVLVIREQFVGWPGLLCFQRTRTLWQVWYVGEILGPGVGIACRSLAKIGSSTGQGHS